MKISEAIINSLAPTIETVVSEKFAELLRKIQPGDTRKNICISLYVPITTELERFALETKTKIDDIGVEIFKQAIETIATEDHFDLPKIA